jgi:hypothetical protein
VKLVGDTSFSIPAGTPINTKVFVFGKQHNDVRFVDYDAVSMLNVSATQELAKKMEALEQENSDLRDQAKRLSAVEEQERQERAEIAVLKAANEKLSAIAAEVATLKKTIATMQEKENGGVQAVALEQ